MLKLPRTLHIEGSRVPAGSTNPDAVEFNKLQGQFLVIEEKVDGTGCCICWNEQWESEIWHRGTIVSNTKEFKRLHSWVKIYEDKLFDILEDRYVLFGEWMNIKHTIFYDRLPHLFLESDIYDKQKKVFLSTNARRKLLKNCDFIFSVPVLKMLKVESLDQIVELIGKPRYQSGHWEDTLKTQCMQRSISFDKTINETDCSGLMEGLYIKHEDNGQVVNRYKYVRYEFVQNIINSQSHIMDRVPLFNMTDQSDD
jgi:hypothetical protein